MIGRPYWYSYDLYDLQGVTERHPETTPTQKHQTGGKGPPEASGSHAGAWCCVGQVWWMLVQGPLWITVGQNLITLQKDKLEQGLGW